MQLQGTFCLRPEAVNSESILTLLIFSCFYCYTSKKLHHSSEILQHYNYTGQQLSLYHIWIKSIQIPIPTELYCQLTEPLYNHEECGTATPNLTLIAAARQGQNQRLYLAVLQNMMVLSHSTGVAILVRELHKAVALWHACLVALKLHNYCWTCNCSCLRSCHCPVLFQNLQRPQNEWKGGREREMI